MSDKFDYYINLPGKQYRAVKSRQTLKIDNQYFIKKYYPLSISEIIKNILSFNFSSINHSAVNEYNAIKAVQGLNIKTLNPIRYGVKSNLLGFKTSYLVTESLEPCIELSDVCKYCYENLSPLQYYKFRQIILKFIAHNTRKLHLAGLNHRDYYICHYLFKLDNLKFGMSKIDFTKSNFTSKLYLIDLHRMQIRKTVPNRYIIKDISAMLFSVRNFGFSMTDYLKFIKYYFNVNNKILKNLLRDNKLFFKKILNKSNSMREKG